MGLKFLEPDDNIRYIAEIYEAYKKAGMGIINDLYKNGKRPALVVIDMDDTVTSSEYFFKDATEETKQMVYNSLQSTCDLVNAARKKGIPIIYIISPDNKEQSEFGPLAEKLKFLLRPSDPKVFESRSKLKVVNKLLPVLKGDHIIKKVQPSAFCGTRLPQVLTYNRVDTCITVGQSTSGCVRVNAIDLVSNGYYSVIVEDCCFDRAVGPAKASLFDLATKYCDVVTLNDILMWINTFPNMNIEKLPTFRR